MEKMSIQGTENRGNLVVKTATWEEFTIQLVRPQAAPESAEFRPGRVVRNNVEWWSFKGDHFGYRGSATLVECDEELFICLVSRGYLDQIFPIRDLPSYQKTKDGERIGGRNLKKLIDLKEVIASELGLEPLWSIRETKMRQAIRNIDKAERDAKEAAAKQAEAQAAEERKRAREEVRAKILARRRQYVYTASGEKRNGIPVVGDDEWVKLPDGTFCILVESYSDETAMAGAPIESFVVSKKGMKKVRSAVVPVTRDNPQRIQASSAPLAVESVIVTIQGVPEEVIPVPDMDAVRELNRRGLNSGTLVLCPMTHDKTRYTVYRLTEGKIETVTTLLKQPA
jgi:hypothetical protein